MAPWPPGATTLRPTRRQQRRNRTAPVTGEYCSRAFGAYGKTVVAIAAGDHHSLALCSDGTVAAWGANCLGQLGDNTMTQRPCRWR